LNVFGDWRGERKHCKEKGMRNLQFENEKRLECKRCYKKERNKKKCNLLKSFIIVDFFFLAEKENKIL